MLPSTVLTLVLCGLLLCSELGRGAVFLEQQPAGRFLSAASRRRRANAFLMEEMLPGDLERECYEEACSQEEAAEIFQSRERTMEFWFRYTNPNPCQTNPCLNGGFCSVDRGVFICICPPQYQGRTCESVVSVCGYKNGGCMQYCRDRAGGAGVQCGCADGYELEADGQSCSQTASFSCGLQQMEVTYHGRSAWTPESEWDNVTMETNINITASWEPKLNLTDTEETTKGAGNETAARGEETEGSGWMTPRIVGGMLEKAGGSPWQVLIRRSDGYGFCGGTLVSDRWVVSAAHCLEEPADHITIGDTDKQRPDPAEQRIQIQRIFMHPHFHSFTFDSDIALLYLSRPVVRGPTALPACLPDLHLSQYLLKEENLGKVTGWGVTRYLGRSSRFLRRVMLPVVSQNVCSASTEQVITDNMFCAGYPQATVDACSGDSGGPFVVNYRGTWFLTGVVSWGEQCATKGKYGIYTRIGNFLPWIRETMDRLDLNGTRT
ncbi:coagulation factor X [Betta splendens]|uniref:Coagulation factor X n=1 Tax=Betta splendens TaxID=158456 RepID=A0A6P7P3V1_BETSP|nr:coagulation factor X [Betta splendens]